VLRRRPALHVQVARPPKLRVVGHAAAAWEGSPVAEVQRLLMRARKRLQCAGENFE
jgi:hypothetical protein